MTGSTGPDPAVSVVLATHNRPRRLSALLDSLRQQTEPKSRFEVVVVDDASDEPTPSILAEAAASGDLQLHFVRRDRAEGPAAARNDGWAVARAPLVLFTDDDCVATPGWVEAMLAAAERNPGAVIQGWLEPDPAEMEHNNPFAHTMEAREEGPAYGTWNILYPRDLLERLGGFDASSFRAPGGEDTDLGWRAHEAGAPTVFAADARMFHGVMRIGAIGRFRVAMRWTDSIVNYKRHPGLRENLVAGLFWRYNHWLLARFLVALALPRWLGPVRLMLAAPYVVSITNHRPGPVFAPYLLALDLVEMAAVARGAVRYRTPVL